MKVLCKSNEKRSLSSDSLIHEFSRHANLDFVNLTIGSVYCVYGLIFRDGNHWYLICDSPDSEYPTPHFFGFFEVVDGRIPKGWSLTRRGGNFDKYSILPDRWSNDPEFLEKLVDGDKEAMRGFLEVKSASEQY